MLHIIRWWYHFKTRTLHFLYFIKLWIDWIAFQITPFYLNILSWIWVLKTHIECHVQCPLFRIRCIVNYSFMYEMRMYRFFFYFCRRFFSDISMTKFKMIVRTLNKKNLKHFQILFYEIRQRNGIERCFFFSFSLFSNNLSICFRLGQDMYNSISYHIKCI